MTDSLEKSYDDLPYAGLPFAPSHPNRLATVAKLYGLTPPPIETAKVLELGCGTGGNVIPMALTMPEARFLGIDLSGRQIEEGCSFIEQLGLTNIELKHTSILEIDDSFGKFDYILTHGVFSWVPPNVREKILAICAANLTPDGVAYISYNTFPGWHLRNVTRDILKFHSQNAPTQQESVNQSRQFLEFLVGTIPEKLDAFGMVIKQEAQHLSDSRDAYVFHEYLESENHPLYFHEFVSSAESHGLNYLGDTDIDSVDFPRLSPDVHKTLLEMSQNVIDFEQRADFTRGRIFRRSLLCHNDRHPQRPLAASRVTQLHLASTTHLTDSNIDVTSENVVEFQLPNGKTLSTNNPLVKVLLLHLGRHWPQRFSFDDVCLEVRDQLHVTGPNEIADLSSQLAEVVLQCFLGSFLELHEHSPTFASQPSDKPLASPLAHLQVRQGVTRVTNLLHLATDLNPLNSLILPLLDGTRDRVALVDELVEKALARSFNLEEEDVLVTDPQRARELLEPALETALQNFASTALLIR